ncbi:MAG: hypothetical protein ACE5KE_12625 [Methanosarcinales archaeon]
MIDYKKILYDIEKDLSSTEFLEKIERWEEEDIRYREERKKGADWKYIEKLPKDVRNALEIFIETGDIIFAARSSNLPYLKLNDYRIKAKIPYIV